MKISVVTAAGNSGKTIEDTIRSVLEQKYTNVEHIIKDGGSKDDTLAICERYKNGAYSSFDGSSGDAKTLNILSGQDKGIYDAKASRLLRAT